MAATRTIQFLPEIFRTDTNQKFLNATLDQLVTEPDFRKINGYIGREFAPSYKSTDNYIAEPSTDRQNYQLEPHVVINNPLTNNLDFYSGYTDVVNKIGYYGGNTTNHNRLFNSEYYTFDGHFDLDKFVNFNNYYWLPYGPDAVPLSSGGVPKTYTYDVTFDSASRSWRFSSNGVENNPNLILEQGGTYTFNIDEPGNQFYIQTKPSQSGMDPAQPNIDITQVLGVENNGTDVGTITFNVPPLDAQTRWTSMPIAGTADFATTLSYAELQGRPVSDIQTALNGIDGYTGNFDLKTVIFIGNYVDDKYWTSLSEFDTDTFDSVFDISGTVPENQRTGIFRINVVNDTYSQPHVLLTPIIAVNNNTKVYVQAGVVYATESFYVDTNNLYQKVPLITAPLTTLYYQSRQYAAAGSISISNTQTSAINPAVDIVGKTNYTSPNGVTLTNGLKVKFDSTATGVYAGNSYYVEGVGSAIVLIDINNTVTPELSDTTTYIGFDATGHGFDFDQFDSTITGALTTDYITINRASQDLNAWSRSNRWFHIDVITSSASYLGNTPVIDQLARAQRPIIEFEANLQLFNYGKVAKLPVDILDTNITNVYTQLEGLPSTKPTSADINVNGTVITIKNNSRIIFSADSNPNVRNKIYRFNIDNKVASVTNPEYICYITEEADSLVEAGHTIIVLSGDSAGLQYYFNGSIWIKAQQKTEVNQPPLIDVVDSNGNSFSDKSIYTNSSFAGTKLFSYSVGTGTVDKVLGFPLSYRNFNNIGDIQFQNNFDLDTFTYLIGSTATSASVNTGLLVKNSGLTSSTNVNLWSKVNSPSKQYQLRKHIYDGANNYFELDVLPNPTTTQPNLKIVVNNTPVALGEYAIVKIVDRYAVAVNSSLMAKGDTVYVQVYSDTPSSLSYYQIPTNLDLNSLNTNFQLLTLGQIRNHLKTVAQNNTGITGQVPGNNNLRDIVYKNTPGTILQHSAPQIYSNLFLVNKNLNFINGLRLAQKEYSKFKNRFLENALKLEIDYTDPVSAVDTILNSINAVKNQTFPWYYSDMVPYGQVKTVLPTYKVLTASIRSYEITSIFNDAELSNSAVLVYLTRIIAGVANKTQLVKDRDYKFDQDKPSITFLDTFDLVYGDEINIVEYTNTDGNYIPETPTKLGLYPKFVPSIFVDNTYLTPTTVIQGHDGSITPAFGDFRDQLLLELELRIYNNLKITYNKNNFNLYDYIPGKFRLTEYNLTEFNRVITQNFLEWVGTNRLDYSSNTTATSTDGFTWNYKGYNDLITGEAMPGSWRAVFKYLFDTDRPHTHPWEMLGFTDKPTWWEERYGPAPYTSGNTVLWSDLSIGYIYSGDRVGFDAQFQRPGLFNFIPVDDQGNLRAPSDFLTKITNTGKIGGSWEIGNMGPTETAWRRSSDYPFAVQYAMALMKPARFFGTLVNIERYRYLTALSQFGNVTTNKHLQPTDIQINGYVNTDGTVVRTAGYINWVRDYLTNLGISNSSSYIKNILLNLNVQLAYHVGGYTDKNYITVLAEQSSPSSINDSIVVPNENYTITLNKSSPTGKISYSAVIVERTNSGYTVTGYNLASPYFTVIPSQVDNNFYTIKSGSASVSVYRNYRPVKVQFNYGTEFTSVQQLADFLVGYQRYLKSQGFVFTNVDPDLQETLDWTVSIKEFLHWSQQGWAPGNVIVLSPVNTKLTAVTKLSVVDEIKNAPYSSKVLDVNFATIKSNNFSIARTGNQFDITSISGQTIAFAELDLVQFEQTIVFDNQTVFNDIIYSPETGNRQYRLKLVGNKTGDWDGSFSIPGFVYNNNQINDWQPGTDYQKGDLVKYKSSYYTAIADTSGSATFVIANWSLIDGATIKSGLLNNFGYNSGKFNRVYDIDNPVEDASLLQFSQGLTGFRSRSYLTDIGVDNDTQAKFYQGFIKQKGTLNAVNAFQGAQFGAITSNIAYNEEWAIRVGEYGALDSNNYIEVVLPETNIHTSPTPIEFIENTAERPYDIQSYNENDVYRISGSYSPDILKTRTRDVVNTQDLPTAGYVNLNDVDATIFDIRNYAVLDAVINNIRDGYKIWAAKSFDGQWNVYRSSGLNNTVLQMSYTNDSLVKVYLNRTHNLSSGDVVVIKNFDSRFDGFYQVFGSDSSTTFFVVMYQNLDVVQKLKTLYGSGVIFHLTSMRITQPSQVLQLTPPTGWINGDKVWIDGTATTNWEVYNKTDPWAFEQTLSLNPSEYIGNDQFGTSVKFNSDSTVLYSGSPNTGMGRLAIFQRSSADNSWSSAGTIAPNGNATVQFGQAVDTGKQTVVVAAPGSNSGAGYVYVYKAQSAGVGLSQILTAPNVALTNAGFGTAVSVSKDDRWMYISSPGVGEVYAYAKVSQPIVNTTFTVYGNEVTANLSSQGIGSTLTNVGGNSGNFTVYNGLTSLIPGNDYTFTAHSISLTAPATQSNASVSGTGVINQVYTSPFVIGPVKRIRVDNNDGSGSIIKTEGNIDAGQGDYRIFANSSSISTIVFSSTATPTLNANIYIENGTNYVFYQNDYYTLEHVISADHTTSFGSSIKSSTDGTQLAVGAKKYSVNGFNEAGAVFVYGRSIEKFTGSGTNNRFITKDPVPPIHYVELNGVTQRENVDYAVVAGTVTFAVPPTPGSTISVDTNQFRLINYFTDTAPSAYEHYGESVEICPLDCTVYATAPRYKTAHYVEGAVFRYTNQGKVYGTILGTVQNPTVTPGDWFSINGFKVSFDGSTLDSVVKNINNASILGVQASNLNGYLYIESILLTSFKKLDINPGSGTALTDLGLNVFVYTQTITNPVAINNQRFASGIAVADTADTILVSSSGSTTYLDNTFDSITTTFDSGATKFTHPIPNAGAVYVFDLMTNTSASAANPALFAYTQQLEAPNISGGMNFGASMAVANNYMAIGSNLDSEYKNNGGVVSVLAGSGVKGWELIRSQSPAVDLNSLGHAFIYNNKTQQIIQHLDYIDPAKGKILGAAEQFIDIKSEFDPAVYNSALRTDVVNKIELNWNSQQRGRTWWDLSTIRYVDYEQDTITYRSKNWGRLFPGSVVTVYEWVESNYLPSQYVSSGGDGTPKYPDDTAYCSVVQVNPSTGIVTSTYYFWVSKKVNVDFISDNGRKISTIELENIIRSPESQGISYSALLAPNAMNLYNISDKLVANEVVLHLDTTQLTNTNIIHSEYQLITESSADTVFPKRIITKLRDSLSGLNSTGQVVPDPTLKASDRYGVLIRPRQGLFINRQTAVENFVDKVNQVMAANPVALQYNITTLKSSQPVPAGSYDLAVDMYSELDYINRSTLSDGSRVLVNSDSNNNGLWVIYSYVAADDSWTVNRIQSYNTSLYWTYSDWYAVGFDTSRKITKQVAIYADIKLLSYSAGDIIKVLNNGNGNWSLYEVLDNLSLQIAGVQNGTVQLLPSVYNLAEGSMGFDADNFGIIRYDQNPFIELGYIFDAIYNDIFVGDLSIEFNNLFFTLVNYIFTEQLAPDWIFKTSFATVTHYLRTLAQLPSFVNDNQTYYQDYINEIKPYRTQVREYLPVYSGTDQADGRITDFDLPVYFDTTYNRYRPLDNANIFDANVIATTDEYQDWLLNYTYSVTELLIENPGSGYTVPPIITISGGGGSGATAIAEINLDFGTVTNIIITNPGSGYTTTPTVTINGNGIGATAYAILNNEYYSTSTASSYNKVRNLNTTIKFDRINYTSNVQTWSANTAYANNAIVSYNGVAYQAVSAWNTYTDTVFDPSKYTELTGDFFTQATDRISAYYQPATGMPGRDFAQLMTGIDYPGTEVKGLEFTANTLNISSNVIGFNYQGMTITSANTSKIDFVALGFSADKTIEVRGLVPFAFDNNARYTILSVTSNAMMLTGAPVTTISSLVLSSNVTVNAGDFVQQTYSPSGTGLVTANGRVVSSTTNSNVISVISTNEYVVSNTNYLLVNNANVHATVANVMPTGTADVELIYFDDANTSRLDTIIQSSYTDTALGTRPEDINVDGGAYVDQYNSHAPEELIPGRMYDTLSLKVMHVDGGYSWAWEYFYDMNGSRQYYRLSDQHSTTLRANLNVTDSNIQVVNAARLSAPNTPLALPGVVYINGEKITYYGIDYTNNVLTQIRRGVDGTGTPQRHLVNSTAFDNSLTQEIPWNYVNTELYLTGTGTKTAFNSNVDIYGVTSVKVNGNIVQNYKFVSNTISPVSEWDIEFSTAPPLGANIAITNQSERSFLTMTGNTIVIDSHSGGFIVANTVAATFMKQYGLASFLSNTFSYTDQKIS
jgi:hypothetical protein